MLTVDEVLQVIANTAFPLAPRQVPLGAALGCVLAQDVVMDEDSPRFDRSQLDGFAVRAGDTEEGARLRLVGKIDAGGILFSGVVNAGECVGINTGGVVPAGADAILMVERASVEGDFVVAKARLQAGYGVQRRGSDAAAGETLLASGARLGAGQLGICAAAGVGRVMVRQAQIAVLTTGDELVDDVEAALGPGKIRNSNRPMLCALAAEAGAKVLDLGTCVDEEGLLREKLKEGLANSDLLLVSGGMSMGTRDLVPPLLKELGVTLHVEKVRVKPGKPFIWGTAEVGGARRYVAGLPGNPVSGFVTFQRFVRHALALMVGGGGPKIVRATTAGAVPANGDREFYQPCLVEELAGGWRVRVSPWKSSADLFTLGRANGLMIRQAEAPALAAGDVLDVLLF